MKHRRPETVNINYANKLTKELSHQAADPYAVATALVNVALNWPDLGANTYTLQNQLTTTFKLFGKQDALEITGRLSLLVDRGDPLFMAIQAWCQTAIRADARTPCAYVQ